MDGGQAPNPADAPPLGVYIHWPYCARICPYCDFNVVRDRGRAAEQAALVEAIATDLATHAARIGPHRLVSVYFGGGTPSLMAPADVARLIDRARSLWPAPVAPEATLEANPTDAEADRFAALGEAGIDRLSLGVQALDDATLRFLGRNHDAATAGRAVGMAARVFRRVSLDLIYALPGQDVEAWAAALRAACEMGVEHISPYQLTIEPGAAFHRAVRRGEFRVADCDVAADLYETTQTVLEQAGFHAYEVSNHARGLAARSRHNLVYWRGEAYVGVGPGAHGRLGVSADAEGGRLATEAEPRIADYIAEVRRSGVGWRRAEALDPRARLEERVLMGLRIAEGTPLAELSGLDPALLRTLVQSGFLRIRDARVQATPKGRMVLDRVTAELLA